MRITLSFAIVAGLAACGGGETTTSTGTPTGGGQQAGSALAALGQTSTAQSGFATAGSDVDNVPDGERFSQTVYFQREQTPDFWSAGETDFEVTYVSPSTIDLTVDGRSFRLTRNSASTGRTDYRGGSGPAIANLTLIDIPGGEAKIAFSTIDNYDIRAVILQREIAWGSIGYATDPSALQALASADYTGTSLFEVFETGIVQSQARPANLTADFTGGNLTGTTSYISLETGSPTTIDVAIDGVIAGNAFEATTDIRPSEVGLATMSPLLLKGRFYGPGGETLIGQAGGTGRTSGITFDNLAYYFEMTANRK